jgi:hypothetical protein
MLSRQGEKLTYQPLTARGRMGNLGRVLRQGPWAGVGLQEVSVQQNNLQRIVQLMRHTGQQ